MRMFPHVLTIVKRNKDGGYTTIIDSGYYWRGADRRSLSNEGADKSHGIEIVCPLSKVKKIDLGDYVLKGRYNISISTIAELDDYDYVTVVSKEVYDVGSNIDNVILRCQ